MPLHRCLSCCLITAFAVTQAHASHDHGTHVSEADYLGALPIVLSVARLSQPKEEAPVATTVIDREMIVASGAQDIASLLALVPGFQVAMVDGTNRSVTYQGFSDQFARRMQVLVDGRSVYNPASGGVNWAQLPIAIEDVERIEVVRGPNAAAYGSNAFLGVISIITRDPAKVSGLEANATTGSNDTFNSYASVGIHEPGHDLRINAKHEQNSGFPDRIDDTDSISLNLRGEYRFSPVSALAYHAGLRSNTLGAGFVGDAFQPPREADLDSNYQQLVWTRLFENGSDLRIQYYHNGEKTLDDFSVLASDIDPSLPPLQVLTGITYDSERHDLEIQHRYTPFTALRLVWGGGLRYDAVDSAYLIENRDRVSRSQGRLFGNAEWHARSDLVLHGSLMGEIQEDAGVYLSPRLAANYLFAPHAGIRLSAARAYRFPSLLEQYGHYAGYLAANPAIEAAVFYDAAATVNPERIDAYEIGLVQQLPRLGLELDIKAFEHHVSDVIVAPGQEFTGATSIFQFQNGGSYQVRGIELAGRYQPHRDTLINLSWSLADGSGNRIASVTDAGLVVADSGNSVPEQTLSLLLSKRFNDGYEASTWLQHVGEMNWQGDGDLATDHTRLDLRLGKSWKVSGSRITLSVVAQNILNEQYNEFGRPMNSFDRRFYGQLAVYPR